MTARPTKRADELVGGDYILDESEPVHLAAVVVGDTRTVLVDTIGQHWDCANERAYALATEAEAERYEGDRIRRLVVLGFQAFGHWIAENRMPVPDLSTFTIAFDVTRQADVDRWSQVLGRPIQPSPFGRSQVSGEVGFQVVVSGPVVAPRASEPPKDWPPRPRCPRCGQVTVPTATDLCPPCVEALAAEVRRETYGSYDPQPTLMLPVGCSADDVAREFEKYARSLDDSHPGWHNDRTEPMSAGLAVEARKRRAGPIERPPLPDGVEGMAPTDGHRGPVDPAAFTVDRSNMDVTENRVPR